jgi:VanZ family protein
MAAMPAARLAGGVGAGAVSPRILFGDALWPQAEGADHDTDGYLVVRAEMGWAGLIALVGASLAALLMMFRVWHRARSPWPRLLMPAGIGTLAANLLYFRYDAVALLAPNLLALAAVFGLGLAWSVHGVAWRPARLREFGEAHWPLFVGAVALVLALGVAENEMIEASGAGPEGVGDKVVHFATFAALSLLLCYALGPQPSSRHLLARILFAVVFTTAMGVALEFGQRLLTAGRQFDVLDMVANFVGAASMGWLWGVVRLGQVSPPVPPSA